MDLDFFQAGNLAIVFRCFSIARTKKLPKSWIWRHWTVFNPFLKAMARFRNDVSKYQFVIQRIPRRNSIRKKSNLLKQGPSIYLYSGFSFQLPFPSQGFILLSAPLMGLPLKLGWCSQLWISDILTT